MSQIGGNIKKLRKVKGLSQQAFADIFSLSRGNISSYEELRAEPKIEVILHIANYFSIPVDLLLQKKLTVNEIVHFEDHFKEEGSQTAKNSFAQIPFLGKEQAQNIQQFDSDWTKLPKISFPIFSSKPLLAIQDEGLIPKPIDFPFEEHSILFFEQLHVEILHTLDHHFGFYIHGDDFFFGNYHAEGKHIEIQLNEWKKAVFEEGEITRFWKLIAKFDKIH
ncbi:helix-turn-helix domain-containing protein [Sphingobacterium hungaricum]|uniref:XRE family transcriptional regulator n=1 Tax=Sphingobacterium hungaricum TaxID=2082723 RepID=A0A928UY27_9SPHI|nr:helix-turn-helix transcriptional regulator [Sphingobacterium hungaricum]MBE8713480.1 XRE family transcriptional regulator [Sphingobacterium hungaricum]